MSARAFLDTNVLVYAFDRSEPGKRERARTVLASDPESLAISAQVLGEFYAVVTRKLARPVNPSLAEAAIERLASLRVVPVDASLTRAAVATSQEARLSYWDALIVEGAAAAGCDRLLSEDLADGATIRGVRIENPFQIKPTG